MSTAARDISESAGRDAVGRESRTSLPERYERWREAFDNGVKSSIHPGAQVLDVGEIKAFDQSADQQRLSSQGVPITFALNLKDAQRVAYAESFARI